MRAACRVYLDPASFFLQLDSRRDTIRLPPIRRSQTLGKPLTEVVYASVEVKEVDVVRTRFESFYADDV